MRVRRSQALLLLLASATMVPAARAQTQDTASRGTPSEAETQKVMLSGQGPDDAVAWDFTIDRGRRAGERATIPVPSNWQQHGFGT